jgi:Fibronectin type III domain
VEKFSRVSLTFWMIVCALFLGAVVQAGQQSPDSSGRGHRPVIIRPDKHDASPELRHLPVIPPRAGERRSPHPPLRIRPAARPAADAGDPVAQTSPGLVAPATIVNFDGINNVDGVLPPDTNGDIGPNHYVQWVNLSFAIYDRTGSLLYGPADGSTIWQGFGGPCESSNDGDPIVLYDHLADRWLLTQFALPSFPLGPYYQCIAVSTSGDPQGAYHRYQFSFNKLNDYPKFGVWPDGYYMAINQFTYQLPQGLTWAGQGVAAFDRARMLSGQAASMVYFDLYGVDPNLGGMLPSELDGAAPPAGSPNYFVQVDDDAWGYSPDQLQAWKFAVNWTSPSSSTFTLHRTLATAAFDSNMCSYARSCIPQAGTSTKLDAISDRLMYRLQYRNLGTHDALVVNHTVDVSGNDRAGVRWYEVRNPGSSAVTIHQQGTFAPADGAHRWMGSAAMDSAGNIALGYNASSGSVSPSIRYTARCASDPAGQMTQGEADLIIGSGAQTSSSSRWGDYSMLGIDPVDGRTFWFTGEYYATTGTAPWRTRVGSFKLDACGGGGTPPAAPSGLTAAAASSSQISLGWTDNSSNENGFRIERCQNAGCSSFSQIAEVGSNVTAVGDSGLAPSTTYVYRVRAFNAEGTSSYSNAAEATTQAAPPASNSHVGDLDGSGANDGRNWTANVMVSVHDTHHSPVANAMVSGTWSNGATGSAACTTNSSGSCTVSNGGIRKKTGSVSFSVTAVSHAGLTYTPPENHDPDGDSNGTTITVSRP